MRITFSKLNKPNFRCLLLFILICPLVLISNFSTASAQTNEDIKTVSNIIEVPQYKEHYAIYKPDKNVIQIVSRALFGLYKNYISSQDAGHCSFSPSCSEYALQSIKKKGLFIGLVAAFDRLSRCNGLNSENYPIKKGTTQLYDPVD